MLPMTALPPTHASDFAHALSEASPKQTHLTRLPVIPKPVEPTPRNYLRTAVAHALRDYVGQGLGRVASAGLYCGLATLDELGLRITAGVFGSLIGGNLAFRLAEAQIGSDTHWQKAGVTFCTVLGAAAGGTVSALGSNQIISAVGACTLLVAGTSLAARIANSPEAEKSSEQFKLSAATFGLIGGGLAGCIDPVWKVDSRLLPARNLGLVVESTIIELGKSSFERCGPSVDRLALNLEGRVVVALAGMVPYVAATIVLNGYVAGRLQPAYDSIRFEDLIGPALVGAVANAVRGASNALATSLLHRQERFTAVDGRDCLRANVGIGCPRPCPVSDKACVRYFLSACRNAVYARLRDAGFSVIDANMIAQGVYACFAQCRDLIGDLVRGDGWTEPSLRARPGVTDRATPSVAEVADEESVIV